MSKMLVAIVGVLALLSTACGGSSTTAGSDTTDGGASESDGDTDAAGEPFVYESPLGDFLGWSQGNFDAEDAEAENAENQRRAEELTAECMRTQGFEYTPNNFDGAVFFDGAGEGEEEWGSEAWIRKYGFGVSTQMFSQEQVGTDLVGHNYAQFESGGENSDPNQAYVDSLSEGEQEAYYAALYGDQPTFAFEEEGRAPTDEEIAEMDAAFEDFQPTGCQNEAFEQAFNGGGDNELFQQFDDEFGDLLNDLFQRMEASAEVVDHRAEVEACVEGKGFEYLTDENAWEHFSEQLNSVGEEIYDPLAGVDTTGWTDEQFEAAYEEAQTRTLPQETLDLLAEVQADEIATAVAVFECGGGWQNEQELFDEIRIDLEQEFLDENRDQLAGYEGVFGDS